MMCYRFGKEKRTCFGERQLRGLISIKQYDREGEHTKKPPVQSNKTAPTAGCFSKCFRLKNRRLHPEPLLENSVILFMKQIHISLARKIEFGIMKIPAKHFLTLAKERRLLANSRCQAVKGAYLWALTKTAWLFRRLIRRNR